MIKNKTNYRTAYPKRLNFGHRDPPAYRPAAVYLERPPGQLASKLPRRGSEGPALLELGELLLQSLVLRLEPVDLGEQGAPITLGLRQIRVRGHYSAMSSPDVL